MENKGNHQYELLLYLSFEKYDIQLEITDQYD